MSTNENKLAPITPEELRVVDRIGVALVRAARGVPSHLGITALCHFAGMLAFVTKREPEDLLPLIRHGWEKQRDDRAAKAAAAQKT